jgi:uncharacterized protein (DUF849 family)
MTLIQAALNGVTARRQHPRVPYTPEEVADQARRSVCAGAKALHIHPRDPAGAESFEARHVAATLTAVRTVCPGIPIGLSTGLWVTGQDPGRRLALVAGWTDEARPDFASVNIREQGAEELADNLRETGIEVEAGVWSLDDAAALVESELVRSALRVLVEPKEADPTKALATAVEIESLISDRQPALRQLHHGAGATTWPIMRWAIDRGHDIRIGLEDTTFLPDDDRAEDNEELVRLAARTVERRGRTHQKQADQAR